MAYMIVLGALFFLALKGFCGKKIALHTRHTGDAFLFNFLRIAICLIIGLILVLVAGDGRFLAVDGGMLAICALSGLANAGFLITWLLAIQRNTMVTVDVSLTVGSLLPAVLCAILFAEAISWQKMIGFVLILLATAILAGYNKSVAKKSGLGGWILLILAAVSDGFIGFSQQLYNRYCAAGGGHEYPQSVYHFYTYVFASIVLLIGFLAYTLSHRRNGEQSTTHEKWTARYFLRHPLPLIMTMAICLFVANYLQTTATGTFGMPSQVMYPMIKGGCLITVNVTACLFFGEKITPRSVLGSLVALGGIVVMNVL